MKQINVTNLGFNPPYIGGQNIDKSHEQAC